MYIEEFNGTININNGTRVLNHTGMYMKEVRDRFLLNQAVSQSIRTVEGMFI